MKVYLVRHAEPVDPVVDPARPLSDKGRKDAEKTARHIDRMEDKTVGRIFHSGKLRARETAEILAAVLHPARCAEEAQGLLPGDDPSPWRSRLDIERENTMIVGHMPFIARLAALLSRSGPLDFRTSQVSCYERGLDGRWGFIWSLAPDDF